MLVLDLSNIVEDKYPLCNPETRKKIVQLRILFNKVMGGPRGPVPFLFNFRIPDSIFKAIFFSVFFQLPYRIMTSHQKLLFKR